MSRVRAPRDWRGLYRARGVTVHGALGMPLPTPFADESSQTPTVADCSQFPRAGAWFSDPLAWRGQNILSTIEYADDTWSAGCPTRTEIANGWLHQVVGTLPPA